MSVVSQYLTSDRFNRLHRRAAEAVRRVRGVRRSLTLFHDPGDPWSWLLVQVLPRLVELHDIRLSVHTVTAPSDLYRHYPAQYLQYAVRDAAMVARLYGLEAPRVVPGPGQIASVAQELADHEHHDDYLKRASYLGQALFCGNSIPPAMGSGQRLEANRRLLEQLGHYNGGMLNYGGEWFWGIDRLALLEEHLAESGSEADSCLVPRDPVWDDPGATDGTLTCFFSFRSPYSYLAMPRVHRIAQEYGLRLNAWPLIPATQRGVALPVRKKVYIVLDAGREARRLNLPFGRIVDPIGAGVERACAVSYALRDAPDLQAQFHFAALSASFARGIDLASDEGLYRVAGEAGLDPSGVDDALADEGWRGWEEQNRAGLSGLGLWGVPSFRYGSCTLWGQDRLGILESIIRQHTAPQALAHG